LALIAGGLVQAVYGNLQLWGYYPSHHGLYKLTGSFFNPGPYAGYLASVFPAALGFWLFGKQTRESGICRFQFNYVPPFQLKSITLHKNN
ncbi:MAG TPA: hypothetical protein VE912_06515, partial [Bacteroidales bacterium]|nr:hypothetical protein [Bacteroidales bacterium]